MVQKGQKLSKNQRRRLKKKQQKNESEAPTPAPAQPQPKIEEDDEVEIEYVAPDLGIEGTEFEALAEVFDKFTKPEELTAPREEEDENEDRDANEKAKDDDDNSDDEGPTISRRQRKKMKRLSVAELKQMVQRPDVVEDHDVTSTDPKLLVLMKAYRHSVPVPRHWCHKRKYLQGKRGIEKPAFQLPDFISDTGVEKMRAAAAESDANKTIKQRMRERVRPKLGRVELDYQVLHDAFFRHQTKPKMTVHGDMYFEGKEYEVRYESKTPGNISDKLKVALGMQVGAPPPWLINMQRYGPPPSYPRMKIAGLNAPIPEGASYGFHPGGWGKPPVDEYGRPLYGDVFGTDVNTNLMGGPEVEVDRKHWGEIEESESEEESEEEEEEAAQMEDDMDMDTEQAGAATGMGGTETPMDGVTSTISGMETPEVMQLRKGQKGGAESVDTPVSSELYQVLEQQETSSRGQLMGSSYKYVMPTAGRKASAATGVEISLDPSEVGNLDKDVLAVKYQDQVERQRAGDEEREGVQAVLEEHARKKQKKKDKRGGREFKF